MYKLASLLIIKKRLTASLMMVGLLVMGAPAMGVVLIHDDFSTYPLEQPLDGAEAPNGQVLMALSANSPAARPYGIGGSPAMGLGVGNGNEALAYFLGRTLGASDDGDDTNAILTVQWDAKHGEDVGGFWSLIQVAVLETKDNWENVVWSNYHTGPNSANGQWRPCATGW